MEEGLQSIFYVVLAIVFWLGPALLRWLKKRGATRAATEGPVAGRGEPQAPVEDDPFGWDDESPQEPAQPDFAMQAAMRQEALVEQARSLMRQQRLSPFKGDVLALFDKAAADLLAPLAAVLGRPVLEVRVLEGPAESADVLTDLAAGQVVVPLAERATERPVTFALLAGGTARAAVEAWPGLLAEARRVLGLPDPETASAYLAATGRLTILALVSAWLPALLADMLATVQMGPAYAAALGRSTGRLVDDGQALRVHIDGQARIGEPPLHARMYVVCLALDRLGRGEDGGARWTSWNQALEHPRHLVIDFDGAPSMPLEAEQILSTAATVVDGLVGRGLSSLQGHAPAGIPSLAMDDALLARTWDAVEDLSRGDPVAQRPRVVLAAATLAAQRSDHVESRIRKAALDSLAGKRPASVRRSAAAGRKALGERAPDLASLLHTPGFAARAVALGAAISPRRGGRQLA